MAVIVLESPSGPDTWAVSFDGPNPAPEKCVTVKSREDAFLLKRLVDEACKDAIDRHIAALNRM